MGGTDVICPQRSVPFAQFAINVQLLWKKKKKDLQKEFFLHMKHKHFWEDRNGSSIQ